MNPDTTDLARHVPMKFARSLDQYVGRDVAVTLIGLDGMMVTGRFYGVTYDPDGRPLTVLLREVEETTLTITWHSVAMIAHIDTVQGMIDAANAAADPYCPTCGSTNANCGHR